MVNPSCCIRSIRYTKITFILHCTDSYHHLYYSAAIILDGHFRLIHMKGPFTVQRLISTFHFYAEISCFYKAVADNGVSPADNCYANRFANTVAAFIIYYPVKVPDGSVPFGFALPG